MSSRTPTLPFVVLLILVSLTATARPTCAQSRQPIDSLRTEVSELQQGQIAILRELKELRQQFTAASRPREATGGEEARVIDLTGPSIGSGTAKVTIVEFSDYQCPFCGRFFRETFRPLLMEYIQTGRVRYVVKDFPIETLHGFAFKAAEAAHCAGDQGKYWEMHDALFTNQPSLTRTSLNEYAKNIGLDSNTFSRCLDGSKHAPLVRRGLSEGHRAGVSGTPAFFIAVTKGGATQVRPLFAVRGAKSYSEFKRVVDAALANAGAH